MTFESDNKKLPAVIAEEEEILENVNAHLRYAHGSTDGTNSYDEDLVSLRDAIAEAHPEDIPPLVEQMTRLQSLAAQRGLGQDIPVDVTRPYFGHMRLEEEEGKRDVLLGKHTYLSNDSQIRIVDWRNAPVSRIYYSYDEGDDYEEEFGKKSRKGKVLAKRSVSVVDTRLVRVANSSSVFVKKDRGWIELDPSTSRLEGGQGSAIRAEGLSPVRGVLGVDADGVDRKDKHLPEIAALLDKKQFDLISSAASGLIIVQGGAGSGKTTVGLHRIAYLAFQDSKRFNPRNMIVVVFNAALASYISRVLPALGIEGVWVTTFTDWASAQRRRHVSGLPVNHSDETPHVVSRLKKHPGMMRILDEIVDRQDEAETMKLLDAVSGTADEEFFKRAWKEASRMPIDVRRFHALRWLQGKGRFGKIETHDMHPRTVRAAESALMRMERTTGDVVSDWADLITDREALQEAFDLNAPSEFTDAELDKVHEWCVSIYSGIENKDEDLPVIDAEDEAILLRLHQLKKGWLRGRGGRLNYDHMMVDEAQDFSPIELAVLLQTVRYKQPVTLAGDTAQKIVRDSGFSTWDGLLDDLGIRGRRVAPLQVAYRSTAEIMRFSIDVLGPYVGDQPVPKRHGAPVEIHGFTDPGQAVGFLGEALRDLARREPLANVAVIARHIGQAKMYYEGLKKSEVPRLKLVVEEDFAFAPGVEVTEVRQVKGLEFDYVVVVEVNADSYPDSLESRRLLHVGATRAAHQLWLVTTGNPSPILPEWLFEGGKLGLS